MSREQTTSQWLRDQIAEALWRHWADADNEHDADWSIVPDDEKHTWQGYAAVALAVLAPNGQLTTTQEQGVRYGDHVYVDRYMAQVVGQGPGVDVVRTVTTYTTNWVEVQP